jgi:hypothetical protein
MTPTCYDHAEIDRALQHKHRGQLEMVGQMNCPWAALPADDPVMTH